MAPSVSILTGFDCIIFNFTIAAHDDCLWLKREYNFLMGFRVLLQKFSLFLVLSTCKYFHFKVLKSVPLSYKNDEVTLLRLHGVTLTINMYDRFCCLEQLTRFALIHAKARLFQGSRSFKRFHTTSSKYYGVMCLN